MARTALPIAFLILFSGLAMGLSFDVDVAEVTDHTAKDLEYDEDVETVQNINATVENTGSIGCSYRFKAEFQQGNDSFTRYSYAEPLWQGAYSRLEINYISMNYTGLVDTNLSVEYCGQEKEVDSFEFNVTENTLPGAEIDSRTVRVDNSSARVEIGSGDKLVPEETPSYWKASSAQVINNSARIEYEAPIFSKETLKYTVLENGEIAGSVNVKLEEQPTRWEKMQNYKLEGLTALLILSVLVNLGLYAEKKGLREKIPAFDIDFDVPDFRKTD